MMELQQSESREKILSLRGLLDEKDKMLVEAQQAVSANKVRLLVCLLQHTVKRIQQIMTNQHCLLKWKGCSNLSKDLELKSRKHQPGLAGDGGQLKPAHNLQISKVNSQIFDSTHPSSRETWQFAIDIDCDLTTSG